MIITVHNYTHTYAYIHIYAYIHTYPYIYTWTHVCIRDPEMKATPASYESK